MGSRSSKSPVLGLSGSTSKLKPILDPKSFSEGKDKSSRRGSEEGEINIDAGTDSSMIAGNINSNGGYDNSDREDSLHASNGKYDEYFLDSQVRRVKERLIHSIEPFRGLSVPQIPINISYAVPLTKCSSNLENNFLKSITISDDQSAGSKIEERNLLVLRDRITKAPEAEFEELLKRTRSIVEIGNPIGPPPSFSPSKERRRSTQRVPRRMRKVGLIGEEEEVEKEEPQARFSSAVHSVEMGVEATAPAPNGLIHTTENLNGLDDQEVKTNLQDVLNGADASQLDLRRLQEYIELLEEKARQSETIGKDQAPYRWQIIYRIRKTQTVDGREGTKEVDKYVPFFDYPEWVRGQRNTRRLQCNLPLDNFDLYLERNKDVVFIVYRDFDMGIVAEPGTDDTPKERAYHPQYSSETIKLINQDLIEAMKTFLGSRQEYDTVLLDFVESHELTAPYLFIYHNRNSLGVFQNSIPPSAKTQLSLLSKFITEEYAEEYAAADSILSQGRVSPRHLRYLFKPGDLLVSRVDDQYLGYVSTSWPSISGNTRFERMGASTSSNSLGLSLYRSQVAGAVRATDNAKVHVCEISAWHWEFDGNFQRKHVTLRLEIPNTEQSNNTADIKGKESVAPQSKGTKPGLLGVNISELNIFPIQFASAEIIDKCRRRGKTFWRCRTRSYVSYQGSGLESIQNLVDERYMIDLKTYRSLHPDNTKGQVPLLDELGPEAMARDEPPDERFELLLPLTIKGYNLRRKKWFDLKADCISDVKWNKEAFQNLVIDRKARDLITALVSNQIASEKGTDLIMGKGNGLILLLHGGPGTGKTLTAESVAEIAEKPLYRVTCGDVGTKAEDVEKYLESVLYLGKIWGCVVLLDEADVFLEQRSLEDMQRNALVSVFLRVLEYYEGILVLTSNRVGTFDEAFKSRIQLALHYPVLGPYQRLRIWENFFNRLKSLDDDGKVDIADLRDHLEDLKEEKMNGRQIRNAITTARQYAAWKGKTLTYEHLSDVIEVSGRFDQYLDKLNGGFTQDQLAEDEGLRLA